MSISASWKAALLSLPAGAWLLHTEATAVRTLALAVGTALLTFAWIAFGSRRAVSARTKRDITARPGAEPPGSSAADERIDRTPTGRGPRDVRCPGSRATGPSRRSTRR